MTLVFLPMFATADAAVEWCEARGYEPPKVVAWA